MTNKNSKYMINQIEVLYLDGNSIKTISKIINYDINRVYKIIKNLGIARTISEALTGKKATDEHKAQIIKKER